MMDKNKQRKRKLEKLAMHIHVLKNVKTMSIDELLVTLDVVESSRAARILKGDNDE